MSHRVGLLALLAVGLAAACVAQPAPAPPGAARATPLPIVSDVAPDTTSIAALVASVTRGATTDDQRAIALYNYLRYALYHHAYPGEPGGISALKLLNVYGWSLCGGQHAVLAALYDEIGWNWRFRGWNDPGHTTIEAEYGGAWRYLDPFLKFYAWRPDPAAPGGYSLASAEELRDTPALFEQFWYDPARRMTYLGGEDPELDWHAPALLTCGDDIPTIQRGLRSSGPAGSPRGWGGIGLDQGPEWSAVPALAPGQSLSLDWAALPDGGWTGGGAGTPSHSCGDKDSRHCPVLGPILEPYWPAQRGQTWANGTLQFQPDLTSPNAAMAFQGAQNVAWDAAGPRPADPAQPAVLTVRLASPYVSVWGEGSVTPATAALEIAREGGEYARVQPGERWSSVAGTYAWTARVTFTEPLTALRLAAVVQHNQRALPYLAPGPNTWTIGADQPLPPGARVAVTVTYQPGSRDREPQELTLAAEELGRGHHARFSDQPVIVRHTFDQLPATLRVDVPTPAGAHPVYPRMLSIQREVLLPGEARPDLDPPAAEPGATLATLPVPWLIGATPPPPPAARPTRELVLTFAAPRLVGPADDPRLRWPKRADEAVEPGALVLGVPQGELPAPADIVAATLELPYNDSHDRAPTQLALVPLPAGGGAALDLAALGEPVALTILPQREAGPPFDPPRLATFDVTRALRSLIARDGAGWAVRVWPNRSVDDGWTVRCSPVIGPGLRLVVQVATD